MTQQRIVAKYHHPLTKHGYMYCLSQEMHFLLIQDNISDWFTGTDWVGFHYIFNIGSYEHF